jgi:tryptophan synthase alpha chain
MNHGHTIASSDRIAACFAKCAKENRPAVITFTMGGDPTYAQSEKVLLGLPEAGADIVELGMPFSDPTADGPIIQKAGMRSLAAHTTTHTIFQLAKTFRQAHPDIPLILMGYYNPILHYGVSHFVKDAREAGIDGFIVVDLPPEEDGVLFQACKQEGLALIKLVTPTTTEERLQVILPHVSGFLYYVAVAGITGTRSASSDSIQQALMRFRSHTNLPLVVGFGIKSSEQVRALCGIADGVVIGSALVDVLAKAHEEGHDLTTAVQRFVRDLAQGARIQAAAS